MNKLFAISALLFALALPSVAQGTHLSLSDQKRFDSYYSRWQNYNRTNNQSEVRSMEGRMQDVYRHYGIPSNTPYRNVASGGRGIWGSPSNSRDRDWNGDHDRDRDRGWTRDRDRDRDWGGDDDRDRHDRGRHRGWYKHHRDDDDGDRDHDRRGQHRDHDEDHDRDHDQHHDRDR